MCFIVVNNDPEYCLGLQSWGHWGGQMPPAVPETPALYIEPRESFEFPARFYFSFLATPPLYR